MEVKRIFDLLEFARQKFPDKTILAHKRKGKWETFNIEEYIKWSNWVSLGLMAKGVVKGDIIATVTNNRAEWNFLDMGISQVGAIHLAIYPTIGVEEYQYILQHAEPKIVFVSDKALYAKIKKVADEIPSIQLVYCINEVEDAPNWTEVTTLGEQNIENLLELEKIKDSVLPDDIASITYTSGTTGIPKGVMISHDNYLSNAISTSKVHFAGSDCRSLSFLPLSHVYERTFSYHCQYKGIAVYYAESLATIVENLNEVKPQLFSSVPRVLEVIFTRIIGKGKDLPLFKKIIFFWAVRLGYRFNDNLKNSFWYNQKLKLARKLVFEQWKKGLGGNIQVVIAGGAALQTKMARVFWAAGINVLEGYGLTETSPVIASGNLVRDEVKLGTVGVVLEGVEVKIADDGEVLCKGPNVMKGYYKQPEQTAEVIDSEGWFHTGDIGVFEDGKYLRITDRKKEIFKLNNGKYIAPQSLENKLKESFFIEQVMVIGENEKFASAIISPNFSFLHNWCAIHKVNYRDNKELITLKPVLARFQREVNEINKTVGAAEQVKRFRLVTEEWTPFSGELSPTLKLKRRVIIERYKDLVDQIYGDSYE